MADDQTVDRAAQELGHTLCAPLDREALKSVPANAPVLKPDRRHCVLGGFGRDRAMKRRIEDSNMRNMRKRSTGGVDCLECRRVVKRRECDQLAYLVANILINHDRIAKARAAMDHPMRDRIDSLRRAPRTNRAATLALVLDGVELQARRARVDDEDRSHAWLQPGQVQSRISGGSSPCSRP